MLWEPQPRTKLFLAGVGALQTDACRLSQQILAVGHILSSLILHVFISEKCTCPLVQLESVDSVDKSRSVPPPQHQMKMC